MPIYEYRCQEGHTFEVMRRMTDDPLSECQTCSAPVQQIFHPITVHFKGKGFYNTDYGTKKRAREVADSKSTDSAKSDVKPAESSTTETKSADAKPAESKGADAKPAAAKAEKPAASAAPKKSKD